MSLVFARFNQLFAAFLPTEIGQVLYGGCIKNLPLQLNQSCVFSELIARTLSHHL
jgi:hypothetical protein